MRAGERGMLTQSREHGTRRKHGTRLTPHDLERNVSFRVARHDAGRFARPCAANCPTPASPPLVIGDSKMSRSKYFPMFVAAAVSVGFSFFTSIGTARADDPGKPIHALFICGGCCHDYAHQKDVITKGISARTNVEWTIAYDPDTTTEHLNPVYQNPDWSKGYDVVVHDECTSDMKDIGMIDRILKPHRLGLPAVVLHCGMHCYRSEGFPKHTPWFEFTGMHSTGHGAQLPIEIHFLDSANPITHGLKDWTTIHEELYNNAAGGPLATAHPLATGAQGNYKTIVVWTNEYRKKTRVFCTTLGHNTETTADPRYLDLVTRGLLWSIDKLDDAHLKTATGAPQ
jgi:Trehalose utilisation